jgi:hypothetical protein
MTPMDLQISALAAMRWIRAMLQHGVMELTFQMLRLKTTRVLALRAIGMTMPRAAWNVSFVLLETSATRQLTLRTKLHGASPILAMAPMDLRISAPAATRGQTVALIRATQTHMWTRRTSRPSFAKGRCVQ